MGVLGRQRAALASGHVTILRRILGLRKSTPVHIVLLEAHSAPLSDSWLLRAVTFWNNLRALPSSSLFHHVALDSIAQALSGASNWASTFAAALVSVQYPFTLELGTLQPVDMDLVRHLLSERLKASFVASPADLCPRVYPSSGVVSYTYARWFQRPLVRCSRPPLIHLPLPAGAHRIFFRFRAGCSGLPIDTGRRLKVPRAQRVCVHCQSAAVCDELHLVFECPVLQPLREEFSALFTPSTRTMVDFMWQKDSTSVALFVTRGLRRLLDPVD